MYSYIIMRKRVVAVRPYQFKEGMQFLNGAFRAWKDAGGAWCDHCWQPRPFHYFFHRYSVPFRLPQSKKEARLVFVSSSILRFNTFADYVRYEVIPMIWDCWPCFFEEISAFLNKNKVRTAIFTSSMTADLMKKRFPGMNILFVPEGIDVSPYRAGKLLKDRSIDLVEFGRSNKKVLNEGFEGKDIVHKCSKNGEWVFPTNKELNEGLAASKVSLTFPRCDTHPEVAGNIETLTQRYWECMLSRVVMVGRAPFELVNLVGYNPVIEIGGKTAENLIMDVVMHPETYQGLADKNREVALQYAGWLGRMHKIMNFLKECGYAV